jgi:hypothetical protein
MTRKLTTIAVVAVIGLAVLAGTALAAKLNGTAGADRLIGTPNADTMNGLGSGDRMAGMEGPDVMDGGTSTDRMIGGPGDDRMNGGDGGSLDRMDGGDGADIMDGDTGDDHIRGGPGVDTYLDDTGADTFYLIPGDVPFGQRELVQCGPGVDVVRIYDTPNNGSIVNGLVPPTTGPLDLTDLAPGVPAKAAFQVQGGVAPGAGPAAPPGFLKPKIWMAILDTATHGWYDIHTSCETVNQQSITGVGTGWVYCVPNGTTCQWGPP